MTRVQSIKTLRNLADKHFSIYIRTRDADRYLEDNEGLSLLAGKCITCPKVEPIKFMDAGHFITKARCKPLKYDEYNANLQCHNCNRFEYGQQYKHGKAIIDKWGSEQLDRLQAIADDYKLERNFKNWTKTELREIIDLYKKKLKELDTQ